MKRGNASARRAWLANTGKSDDVDIYELDPSEGELPGPGLWEGELASELDGRVDLESDEESSGGGGGGGGEVTTLARGTKVGGRGEMSRRSGRREEEEKPRKIAMMKEVRVV